MKHMLYLTRIILLSFVWILVSITAYGQNLTKANAHHLTTSDGLSNNTVRHIYQDSKGYIWMSTLNGLNRYDGYSFRTFYPMNNGQLSLTDRRVKSVFEDDHGFLWICTSGDRFSCYDLDRDRFVDFTGCGEYLDNYRNIVSIAGNVWLWSHTQGCRYIMCKQDKLTSRKFSKENGCLKSNYVNFVAEGVVAGQVWIGSELGLYSWQQEQWVQLDSLHNYQRMCSVNGQDYFITSSGDIKTLDAEGRLSQMAVIPDVHSGNDLPGNIVMKDRWLFFTRTKTYVFHFETGVVEVASSEWQIPNGVVTVDNKGNYGVYNNSGVFHYISAKTGEIIQLPLMPAERVGHVDMERYHVVHDSMDILWITTYGNGLFTYDLNTKELHHYKAEGKRSDLFGSNALHCIFEDRTGNLWLGTELAGVSHLKIVNEGAKFFYPAEDIESDDYANNVRLLSLARNGNVFMGTRDGKVYEYDDSLRTLKAKQSFQSNIYAICEDSLGRLWKGSRGNGLYIADKHYMHHLSDTTSLSSDEIFTLLRDRKGRMWIGTFGGGLDLAMPDKNKGARFLHFLNATYSQRRIRALLEDRQGWIWAGTSDGVYVFHPDSLLQDATAYYHYNQASHSLYSDEVRSLMQDHDGNIYVAETGAGFAICKPGNSYAHLEFTHFGLAEGLVNSMVQGFVEDFNNRVWVTTEHGVSCFSPKEKTFENYFFSSDMLGNVYSENSVLRLPDGRLLLGTSRGIIVVTLSKVLLTEHLPAVTFTELKLNGIPVSSADLYSPLERAMAYTDEVHLEYNQNTFSIQFSTLDYSSLTPPKYSYKLEGFDKDWSIPSVEPFTAYKNLSSGTYRLKVKACNSAGRWNDEYSELLVIIEPPFWRTGWAVLIYVLLFFTGSFMVFRIIRNFNVLQNKIKVEEQLTEYKLVFFTNISHEFRTPLSLIQIALEKMKALKDMPQDAGYSMKVLEKSTKRMMRLINQLIEFRKMQNNKLALSLEEIDVVGFIYEIFDSFREAAQSKKIRLEWMSSASSYLMYFDKEFMDKIVYNLLSNALKYTPFGGNVVCALMIDESAKKLKLQVKDTGVGIPKEKRTQLFSRFMQSSFSGSSMGVGLHLTHELVVVHKGKISYEENQGGGSVFTVLLPLDSSVYEQKDFLVPHNILMEEESAKETSAMLAHEGEGTEESMVEKPLNKQHLLVIDDDNDVRELLKQELSVYFEVDAASDGIIGLERAVAGDIDLIVCDVMMPGISGFEVTRRLKEDFTTCHIPVILLTALENSDSHLEGVQSGADSFITKPFSLQLLLARIFQLLGQREKLREKFSNDLTVVRPLLSANNKDKEFIDKLTRIIETELQNPEFTIEEFASRMALGRTVFYKKVKGTTGYAPKEYLRVMRMKKAAELLLQPEASVTEVAYQVGMSDPFYFSRCFKGQFGLSPSAYQKNNRDAKSVQQ